MTDQQTSHRPTAGRDDSSSIIPPAPTDPPERGNEDFDALTDRGGEVAEGTIDAEAETASAGAGTGASIRDRSVDPRFRCGQ